MTILSFFVCGFSFAQSDSIRIQSIEIMGNVHTKSQIILRELDFSKNSVIASSDSATIFQLTKNKIFNTELFVSVDILLSPIDSSSYDVLILVKERWYIFPIPILEYGDRNFTEWWYQRNHDIKRLELGVRVRHDNFRGRNEKLKIKVEMGFTKKFEVFHEIPYINKAKTIGFQYGVSYSTNKSIDYKTVNNIREFANSENVLRKRFVAELGLSYRHKFYTKHNFVVRFNDNKIAKEVLLLSRNYFDLDKTRQTFLKFQYSFDHDKTNINYYPTTGYRLYGNFTQNGIGLLSPLALSSLELDYYQYFKLKNKLYSGHRCSFKTSSPTHQPYNLQFGMGYGEDLVRGYQAYAVDGQHFALNRNELKYEIFNFDIKLGKFMPVKAFETVPYAIYFKVFSDVGYTINNDAIIANKLANTWMYGNGFGLDIVSYYDVVLRLEYSINGLNKGNFNFLLVKAI